MARVEDISWGSYQEFEGPFHRGKIKFELPSNPTLADKQLAAITAVESGHYDAINMYDRMILTVGLIQWGEANTFAVSKMLGYICDSGLESIVQTCLKPALDESGATFKTTPKGVWRFFIGNLEVNSIALQQRLFLGCDGRKGNWSERSKRLAKLWAACVASIFENPKAREIQKKYTTNRLMGFVIADAKKNLFEDKVSSPWAEATRAIYLTYAINLPRIAGEMFISTKFVGEKWSPEWCLCLIKRLTFGPNIKIYPSRYNALRPVIEKLYGIELPKNADLLRDWNPPQQQVKVVEQNLDQQVVETQQNSQINSAITTTISSEVLSELNDIVVKDVTKDSNVSKPTTSFSDLLTKFIKKLFNL